jgi:tRNA U34 5-methylaminomethyl-2-thiouridine-forming methyltransferase MnmC
MTWPASAADLLPRLGRDGSFSLWSEAFGEGFHCAVGAVAEARATFVAPAELERFASGSSLTVLEVAVGTGTNTAALLEAARSRGLTVRWWGLEIDPRPLGLALASPRFQATWPEPVQRELEGLVAGPTLLWGDARQRLADLPAELQGGCDLVLHDAFSPRRCPQLWSLDFLAGLARCLAPQGRLISYSSAAAFRTSLRGLGLELAAIRCAPQAIPEPMGSAEPVPPMGPQRWSGGTVASPTAIPGLADQADALLRPLSAMEEEHLATRAALPYRDPSGIGTAEAILAERTARQQGSAAESSSAWRRRWAPQLRAEGMGPPERHR